MEIAAYLLSLGLVWPGVLLALVVQALSRTQALAQISLLKALYYALQRMSYAVTWHLLAAAILVILLFALAFVEPLRWCGTLVIGGGAAGSLGYLKWKWGLPENRDQVIFLLPSAIALGLSLALLWTDVQAPWH